MKSLTKLLSVIIGLIIIFWLANLMMIEEHEEVHAQIYDDYGIAYKKVNNLNPLNGNPITYLITGKAGYVQAIGNNTDNCNEFCKLAHNNNEVVGYNVSSVIGTMFLILMFFVFYRFIMTDDFKDEEEEWNA